MSAVSQLPECGFVRLPTILSVFPVSRSTWYAGVRSGRFPKPKKIGPRISAWSVAEIRPLLEGGGAPPPDFSVPQSPEAHLSIVIEHGKGKAS